VEFVSEGATLHQRRHAKEFLVSKIVNEAQREGLLPSEIEKKMLYFSETGWTLPDMEEINTAFDLRISHGVPLEMVNEDTVPG
jgi:hypothetical protein